MGEFFLNCGKEKTVDLNSLLLEFSCGTRDPIKRKKCAFSIFIIAIVYYRNSLMVEKGQTKIYR